MGLKPEPTTCQVRGCDRPAVFVYDNRDQMTIAYCQPHADQAQRFFLEGKVTK